MIRALMEGVVFDLRHSLECFKQLGLPINEIRIGEGGAKSALWRQIQADVFAQDLQLMDTQDASAVGAAVIAGVGVGVFESFESACERAIVLGERVEVDVNREVEYEGCYWRYSRLYPTFKEWFREVGA